MRLYLSMILLALVVSGCAESDLLIHGESQSQQAELLISPQYEAGQIQFIQSPISRNTDVAYLSDGSEIGVFVHNLTSGQCIANLRWKAFGDGPAQLWRNIDEEGNQTKYYLNQEYSRLYSYYPYTSNPEDLITGHSDADVSGYLPALRVRPGQVDYLNGNGESLVNSGHPATNLSKNHLLTSLNFHVEKKNGYTGAGIISKLIVKNQYATSWFSLSRNTYIPTGITSVSKTDVHVPAQDPENLHVLVIPHTSSEIPDSYFEVTIDGKTHNVLIPDNQTSGYAWERSKRYTYRFCLNPTGAVTAELADFEFGGDWDSSFSNPKVIVNPDGNADELSRPTPYWDDNAQSRKFEISKRDLNTTMSWYEGASWSVTNGSITGLNPASTGCQTYRENGGDWRIPTYHELKFIYEQKMKGKLPEKDFQPLVGIYWSGNWIQNKNHATYWNLDNGTTADAKPMSKYKVRCIRDIVN